MIVMNKTKENGNIYYVLPSPNVKSFIVPTPPSPSSVSMDLKTSGMTLGAIVWKTLKTLKTISAGYEDATSTSILAVVMINLFDRKNARRFYCILFG
jgi:hypothetical protein